jgi:hypothetical protein
VANSAAEASASTAGVVELRYLDRVPISVTGPRSRRIYHFSFSAPVQAVDMRDAHALLATRYFRPA